MFLKNPYIRNVFKGIVIYNIREMTLFNYSKCECCKNKVNDIKTTLHHIFPVNICNRIGELNVYCKYCLPLMEDERKFAKHKHDDVSKIELQIISFQLYNKQPFELKDVKKIKVQKMNTLIGNGCHDDLMFKRAMKSYFNGMYYHFNKKYLPVVGDKKALKEATNHWKGERFSYYNFLYRDDFKFVIYEYLLALIGPDIEYMELDDLHDYLDEVFPK